jgi:cytochrome c
VGGKESLKTIHPIKSVGNWWPFATTLWDFINRAMPANKPGSLSAGEVYALTAVLLYRNGIIKETDRLDAASLPKIQMPNRNGMIPARVEDIRRWRCPVGTCP